MAVPNRDLMKVADVPEVAAAIQARDEALAAFRAATLAVGTAEDALDKRVDELEEVAARALEARRQGD